MTVTFPEQIAAATPPSAPRDMVLARMRGHLSTGALATTADTPWPGALRGMSSSVCAATSALLSPAARLDTWRGWRRDID